MWSPMIVHPLSIVVSIITAMPDWRGSVTRFIVLHEHISFLLRIKQPQVDRFGRFVGMSESVFVPKGRGASVEQNCLAGNQDCPPKRVPFHELRLSPMAILPADWYPHPELNRDQRFRKPLLYPFELWGRRWPENIT